MMKTTTAKALAFFLENFAIGSTFTRDEFDKVFDNANIGLSMKTLSKYIELDRKEENVFEVYDWEEVAEAISSYYESEDNYGNGLDVTNELDEIKSGESSTANHLGFMYSGNDENGNAEYKRYLRTIITYTVVAKKY